MILRAALRTLRASAAVARLKGISMPRAIFPHSMADAIISRSSASAGCR